MSANLKRRARAVGHLLVIALAAGSPAIAASPNADALLVELARRLEAPRAKLVAVGTFHFRDAGLDEYKPQHQMNVLSERRQREIEGIVKGLAAFAPTKVAVEWPKSMQAKTDEIYARYLRGELDSEPEEVYQLGFRLARRLRHERVHAIDVKGRHYEPRIDRGAEASRLGIEHLMDSPWYETFEAASAWEDKIKIETDLRDYLLYLNAPQRIVAGHGIYLVGGFKVVQGDAYPGPDFTSGWWYNRNLRIFANLLQLVESSDERIVLVIGSGHLPILYHAAEASPEIEWVELAEVLGGAAKPDSDDRGGGD